MFGVVAMVYHFRSCFLHVQPIHFIPDFFFIFEVFQLVLRFISNSIEVNHCIQWVLKHLWNSVFSFLDNLAYLNQSYKLLSSDFFMPPIPKKLRMHTGLGMSVCPSIYLYVTLHLPRTITVGTLIFHR